MKNHSLIQLSIIICFSFILTDRHSPGITMKREHRPESDNTLIDLEILVPSF